MTRVEKQDEKLRNIAREIKSIHGKGRYATVLMSVIKNPDQFSDKVNVVFSYTLGDHTYSHIELVKDNGRHPIRNCGAKALEGKLRSFLDSEEVEVVLNPGRQNGKGSLDVYPTKFKDYWRKNYTSVLPSPKKENDIPF